MDEATSGLHATKRSKEDAPGKRNEFGALARVRAAASALQVWASSRRIPVRVLFARLVLARPGVKLDAQSDKVLKLDVTGEVSDLCRSDSIPYFETRTDMLAAVAPYISAEEVKEEGISWRLRVAYEQAGGIYEAKYGSWQRGPCKLPWQMLETASEQKAPFDLMAAYCVNPDGPVRTGLGEVIALMAGPKRDFSAGLRVIQPLADDVLDHRMAPPECADAPRLVLVARDGKCYGWNRGEPLRWPPEPFKSYCRTDMKLPTGSAVKRRRGTKMARMDKPDPVDGGPPVS